MEGLQIDSRYNGFECYRHKKQSALYLKKHGLPEGICELKAFPEWKLELMA